jgi:general secretion pathway protein A
MYEQYWDFALRPFHEGWDPRFYFPAHAHEACLARLRYAVEARGGFAVLLGPSGAGKSFLVRAFFARLPKVFSPQIHLSVAGLTAAEVLVLLSRRIAEENVPWSANLAETLDLLCESLGRNAAEGHHAVVVLDDAHLGADPRLWEVTRYLGHLREKEGSPATFVWVGQQVLLGRLTSDSEWQERLASVAILRSLSRRETREYVEFRLHLAGATRPIFSTGAMDRVYEIARGIPGRINRLCDWALVLGCAEEADLILPEHIETVAEELYRFAGQREEPPALAA